MNETTARSPHAVAILKWIQDHMTVDPKTEPLGWQMRGSHELTRHVELLESELTAVKADNAALLLLATERGCLDLGHTVEPEDPDSCNEQGRPDASSCPACRATRTEHPGTLLLRELRALREKTAHSVDISNGAARFVVHGDEASVTKVRALVLENESLRKDKGEALNVVVPSLRERAQKAEADLAAVTAQMDRIVEALGGAGLAGPSNAADLVRALRESHAQQVRRADAAPDVALEVAALVADAEAQRAGDAAEDAEKRMAVLPGHAARARVIAATSIARDIRAVKSTPARVVSLEALERLVEDVSLALERARDDGTLSMSVGAWSVVREVLRRVKEGQVPDAPSAEVERLRARCAALEAFVEDEAKVRCEAAGPDDCGECGPCVARKVLTVGRPPEGA